MSVSSLVVVGIDVAKAHVDVAVLGVGVRRFDNEAEAHSALQPLNVALVVMEATEAALACALQAAGSAGALVIPRQARDFAKMGRLAKADRLEARMLAEYASVLVRRDDLASFIRPLADAQRQAMAAMVRRRRQLLGMLLAERQRMSLAMPVVRPSIQAMIDAIGQQFDDVAAQMAGLVKAHYKGRRPIRGGCFEVRPVLHLAALTAARHNPVIKTFYEGLLSAGKQQKVALAACMRKLLTLLNAMVGTNRAWDEALHGA